MQTKVEKKLAKLASEHLKKEKITLDSVRKGKAETSLPIGTLNLYHLIRGKNISLPKQIKLLRFFGYIWELKMFKKK